MRRHVYKVDDGEYHWVSATSADEAAMAVAAPHGYTLDRYIDEFQPVISTVPIDGDLRINVSESRGARDILDDFGGRGEVFVILEVRHAVKLEGLICSTVY